MDLFERHALPNGHDYGKWDKAAFADKYLGGTPLYDLAHLVMAGMDTRGWTLYQYNNPSDPNAKSLAVTFKREDKDTHRYMDVSFRSEWKIHAVAPVYGAFIDRVWVEYRAENAKDQVGKANMVAVPTEGEYAVHVWRDDPLTTATTLNMLTLGELLSDYHPDRMAQVAWEKIQQQAADTLDSMRMDATRK